MAPRGGSGRDVHDHGRGLPTHVLHVKHDVSTMKGSHDMFHGVTLFMLFASHMDDLGDWTFFFIPFDNLFDPLQG